MGIGKNKTNLLILECKISCVVSIFKVLSNLKNSNEELFLGDSYLLWTPLQLDNQDPKDFKFTKWLMGIKSGFQTHCSVLHNQMKKGLQPSSSKDIVSSFSFSE